MNFAPELYPIEFQHRAVVETIDKITGAHVPKRQAEENVRRTAWGFDVFYETRQCRSSGDDNTGSVLTITAHL